MSIEDIYSILHEDHAPVKRLMNSIVSGKAARNTFEDVSWELCSHMEMEEEYLYPVLEGQSEAKHLAMHADE